MHTSLFRRACSPLSFALAFLFCGLANARAAENQLSEKELAEGWILLFDGETLYGWQGADNADWSVRDGAIAVTKSKLPGSKPALLCTTSQFGDYELSLEFRSPETTNSGVFLRTIADPTDPAVDCYEINIAPQSNPFPSGSVVKHSKAADGVQPIADAWNKLEMVAEGGQLKVSLNGKIASEFTDSEPLARGLIGLQVNQGPIEFRSIKLKPLGLKSLFNGKDLSGWKIIDGKDTNSVFDVTAAGELSMKNGKGCLESEDQFGDFVMQLEAKANGKHLNSGVFFRAIPGQFWQGYESQIHNGYKDGDRTKPIDCGTGGFYRRQNARRVMADDGQWFYKTLVVSDNHMATWVNGIQVSDWTDPRPPHDNPRQGSRTAAGTLQIQGHDPTTDFQFRKIRAGELPKR